MLAELRRRRLNFPKRSEAEAELDWAAGLKRMVVAVTVEEAADSEVGWRPKAVVATAEMWIRP
jgi:hypothetical protein